ncbi:MAG: methyltransferase domain-containing protein [Calditrichaeota bacterium]|nr:MAG: methyltransferase domain-containing protein [Calditrichota bacterium]
MLEQKNDQSCCEPTCCSTEITHSETTIKKAVQTNYAEIAKKQSSSCCGEEVDFKKVSEKLGYSLEELENVPEGANLGLGCGNPQAIAEMKIGETVLDLGSGAGFDCFLAARQIGETGKVIGVDMTSEMLELARENAKKHNYKNVEFRLGEIENLPLADNSVDVIISNCVINLSPEKQKVYNESYRVLKNGGRVAFSDVVATAKIPEDVKNDLALISGCVGGAEPIDKLEGMLQKAGFKNISITPKMESQEFIKEWAPGKRIEEYTISAYIQAEK